MAQFTFQLEGVLRQRKRVEEQRQRDLALVQQELTGLEAQLRAADQSVKSSTDELRTNHLTGSIDLSFLAAHRRYMLSMQRKALGLAEQIAAVQKRVDAARAVLAEAAKQRKIIEKLREKRHATWSADQAYREMAALDEVTQKIGYQTVLAQQAERDAANGNASAAGGAA